MKFRDIAGNEILTSQAALDVGMFGDGSDSSPVFDLGNTFAFASLSGNTYTLNRSIFCKDMTVGLGKTVNTAGYKIFCTGTLLNNGTITNAGLAGVTGTAGAAIAAVELGGSGTGGTGATGTSGVGTAGSAGGAVSVAMGAAGGSGAAGGAGNSGGGGGAGIAGTISSYRPFKAVNHHLISGVTIINGGAGFDTLTESLDTDWSLIRNKLTGNGTDTLTRIELVDLHGGASINSFTVRQWGGAVTLFGEGGKGAAGGT